jgi:hypothetical protein
MNENAWSPVGFMRAPPSLSAKARQRFARSEVRGVRDKNVDVIEGLHSADDGAADKGVLVVRAVENISRGEREVSRVGLADRIIRAVISGERAEQLIVSHKRLHP